MGKKKFTETKTIEITCPCCEGTGVYKQEVVLDITKQKMEAMREAGMTYQQIADEMGTVISNVYWHLNKK